MHLNEIIHHQYQEYVEFSKELKENLEFHSKHSLFDI